MQKNLDTNYRELFEIIMSLAREIRCCSRDEAICRDLTFHQFIILDAVAKKGELGFADLHQILSVEKSTTTRLVNPLIQRGLLRRARAAHDSRAATLSVTEKGMATHREAWECLGGFFEGIMQGFPAGRRKEVLAAVKEFTGVMKKAADTCRCCGQHRGGWDYESGGYGAAGSAIGSQGTDEHLPDPFRFRRLLSRG